MQQIYEDIRVRSGQRIGHLGARRGVRVVRIQGQTQVGSDLKSNLIIRS